MSIILFPVDVKDHFTVSLKFYAVYWFICFKLRHLPFDSLKIFVFHPVIMVDMVNKSGVGGKKLISQKWLSNETNKQYNEIIGIIGIKQH